MAAFITAFYSIQTFWKGISRPPYKSSIITVLIEFGETYVVYLKLDHGFSEKRINCDSSLLLKKKKTTTTKPGSVNLLKEERSRNKAKEAHPLRSTPVHSYRSRIGILATKIGVFIHVYFCNRRKGQWWCFYLTLFIKYTSTSRKPIWNHSK